MRFITLTDQNGREEHVQAQHIVRITTRPGVPGTHVELLNSTHLRVKETPEEIRVTIYNTPSYPPGA